jgi:hypothetical protein
MTSAKLGRGLSTSGILFEHDSAVLFREIARTLPTASGVLSLFRACHHECIDSWLDMGPPPLECVGEGRYNRVGERTLYLASDAAAALAEVEKPATHLQEYEIDPRKVALADCCGSDLDPLVQGAFNFAEQQEHGSPFSWALASIIRDCGFRGMVVLGVRREKARPVPPAYRNVVIFDPGCSWMEWSRKDAGFHPTGAAREG